jgi:hypothetical protein
MRPGSAACSGPCDVSALIETARTPATPSIERSRLFEPAGAVQSTAGRSPTTT